MHPPQEQRVQRRLAAILAADVAGYSRLVSLDEVGTLRALSAQRAIMDRLIAEHGGRIANTAGDSVLAEFPSAVDAVACAVTVQERLAEASAGAPEDRRVRFRIGVHLGDVVVRGGDLLGDGVNIAARLESLAEPGGVCLSATVHGFVRKTLPLNYADLGEQSVKNIDEPVRVYAVKPAVVSAAVSSVVPAAAASEPKPLPLPDKPSIAVLPFTNMSGDPEQEYFADGISEDLLTTLSRIRWLFVIARNSSFVFKGRVVDVKEIGARLGVRYVLEGSTRKAANRVRITAQLIEAATGAHIWAGRYDRDLVDIFELQDEITKEVISSIEPSLRAAEIARARAKPTEDLDAYDLFLRAQPEFQSFTERGFRQAEGLLRETIKRDPNYAEAWAELAHCVARLVVGGWSEDYDRAKSEACAAASKAVALDPDNAAVLSSAAFTLGLLGPPSNEPVELAARALALHPNSATVRVNCGWTYAYFGDTETALRHFEVARQLSPLDIRGYLITNGIAASHIYAGHYIEAERWARRTLEKWPDHPVALRFLASALVYLHRLQEAKGVIDRLLAVQPNASMTSCRQDAEMGGMSRCSPEGRPARMTTHPSQPPACRACPGNPGDGSARRPTVSWMPGSSPGMTKRSEE